MKPQNIKKTKTLAILSILIGLSFILGQLKLFQLPLGGSITACQLLPIALAGYFFDFKKGILVGILVGLLNLLIGGFVIHPIQMLLDYPMGFGLVGLSGIFCDAKYGLIKGYWLGLFSRFICLFISGMIFFSNYVPENFNSFTWSLCYNGSCCFVEGVATSILILATSKQFEKIKSKII